MKVYIFQGADEYTYVEPRPLMQEEARPERSDEEIKEHKRIQEKRQKEQTTKQRQREASNAIAMIAVGVPLYWYHWHTITKENS